jgi:hypothetical protein
VNVFRAPEGFLIALTYGRESEWVRNVVAAGVCQLENRGVQYQLSASTIVCLIQLGDGSRIPVRIVLRLIGADDFIQLSTSQSQVNVVMPNLRKDLLTKNAIIFGDESADETGRRVFAVAGLMGTEEQWDGLVEKWIIATGGKEFHAAEWETEHANDPDTDKHKTNCRIYADLTQLVARGGLHGGGH